MDTARVNYGSRNKQQNAPGLHAQRWSREVGRLKVPACCAVQCSAANTSSRVPERMGCRGSAAAFRIDAGGYCPAILDTGIRKKRERTRARSNASAAARTSDCGQKDMCEDEVARELQMDWKSK